MTFEITTDWDLVRSVLTIPEVYSAMHDDFSPPASEWKPELHPSVSYVGVRDGDEFLGILITAVHSSIMLEAHNAILPSVGWKKRLQVFKEFALWLQRHGVLRLLGKVPANNKYAVKFNEAAGMERIGVNQKAFMKGGVLHDEVWFGLSLPLSGLSASRQDS